MKRPKDYILLYLKGIGMGAADVIPGVSGGTVALLAGIYGELVHSVRAVDRECLELLRAKRYHDFWTKINGNFLVTICLALLTSLFTMARAVTWLLVHQPILTRAFFFGIIFIAAPLVLRHRKKWNGAMAVAFFGGAAVAYTLSILPPAHLPDSLLFVFLAGAVCIGGLMLPGISGAFLLLFLGKYKLLANALSTFNLPVLLVFLLGALVGLMGFSRILTWIIDNYYNVTLALLAGLMMGSLNKVWPWRQVLEFVTPNQGSQVPVHDKSILPWDFLTVTGKDPQLLQAILMMALGVFIVVLIEKIAARLKTNI